MRQIILLSQRIQIAPGKIKISLCGNSLAVLLDVDPGRVSEEFLEMEAAFQHRKRRVETKLILTEEASPRNGNPV